jgi:hypothetical protein
LEAFVLGTEVFTIIEEMFQGVLENSGQHPHTEGWYSANTDLAYTESGTMIATVKKCKFC